MAELVGSLEAGGTKFVCAVGTGPDDLRDVSRFPTGEPGETLEKTVAYFRSQQDRHGPLRAVGIGCFGPVDLAAGKITSTPKKAWIDTAVRDPIASELGVPVAFDTDVNAAALGEWRWGAARGLDTFVYLTIGTGIGGGGMAGGRLLHGLVHPEMGHMRIQRDRERDPYPGRCQYHRDCWEGLAAGPAIEERWGRKGQDLPPDHEAWELEAEILAQGCANLVCILSPQRIVMGGGVMHQEQLFPLIRKRVQELLNGYVRVPEILDRIDEFIVPPGLGDRAGVLGGIALARRLLEPE